MVQIVLAQTIWNNFLWVGLLPQVMSLLLELPHQPQLLQTGDLSSIIYLFKLILILPLRGSWMSVWSRDFELPSLLKTVVHVFWVPKLHTCLSAVPLDVKSGLDIYDNIFSVLNNWSIFKVAWCCIRWIAFIIFSHENSHAWHGDIRRFCSCCSCGIQTYLQWYLILGWVIICSFFRCRILEFSNY